MDATKNSAHESTARSAHPAPAMDIMQPKVAEAPPAPAPTDPVKPVVHNAPKPHVTRPPKQPSQGIGLAVFATIVIVLALGGMMVYAYLRTNGISIL